jgi:hypothetical protein
MREIAARYAVATKGRACSRSATRPTTSRCWKPPISGVIVANPHGAPLPELDGENASVASSGR